MLGSAETSRRKSQSRVRERSEPVAENRAFVDRAFGIELACESGTADHVHCLATRCDVIGERAIRLLSRADNDGVGGQDVIAIRQLNVQPSVVGLQVASSSD